MVASPDKPIAAETDLVAEYVKSKGGDRAIRKVLIANNGMAATKSILSMRQWAYMELGDEKAIKFVAMATPEDLNANAEFIRLGENLARTRRIHYSLAMDRRARSPCARSALCSHQPPLRNSRLASCPHRGDLECALWSRSLVLAVRCAWPWLLIRFLA